LEVEKEQMMRDLDAKEAYKAMFRFLEKYYELTQSDEIGALLGSMSLLDDGMPADSAIWQEWQEAIAEACPGIGRQI
jgi:hypothetical protein